MRSMFVKIFISFWLATVLSGLVFFLLAFNLKFAPLHEKRKRHFEAERDNIIVQGLTLYGTTAAASFEKDGTLARFPEAPSSENRIQANLFDANSNPLTKDVPAPFTAAAHTSGPGRHPEAAPARDVLKVRVQGPSGKQYLAVARVSPLPPPGEGPHEPPLPFPPEFWLQMLITFVVSGGVCYLLSWRITAPVRRLRSATQELAGGNLGSRVRVDHEERGDELTDLGRDFNLMAIRMEKLVNAHKQLVRDVSHELRSPLARMNVALEIARKRSPSSAEPALQRIGLEGERLNLLIGELLTLSQLDGGGGGEMSAVDLGDLAREVAQDADFEACASDRRVDLTSASGLVLQGNRKLLRRALENVVRNAVRYTAPGTAVTFTLERAAGPQAVVRVMDAGPGVPEGQLTDIFRPFYRVAEARDRESGGTGIGLAISEKTVILHGGTIAARNLPDAGLEVEIRLPLTARQ